MDSWATDGFYSHFPSYSQQENRREALAKARKLDYQTFLSRRSPFKNVSRVKQQKRHIADDGQIKNPKIPTNTTSPNTNKNQNENEMPKLDMHIVNDENGNRTKQAVMSGRSTNRSKDRNEFVNGLEQKDLPDIFNDERVSARNERNAEEKRRRNIQYKEELMAQIEQKRRERELQRLKDERDEEYLNKKLEEQLKSVRLDDGYERKPRCRDHHLVDIELNKPIINTQHKRLPATVRSERPFETNAYQAYDQRKAQSDHGKENFDTVKRSDKEIYNFFTNSARRQLNDVRHSHYFDVDESSENEAPSTTSSHYNTYPLKSSNRHYQQHESRQALCNFCKHNGFTARHQEDKFNNGYICDACENDPICLNCRKEICVRCKRVTRSDDKNSIKQPFQLKHQSYDNELFNHFKAIEYPTKLTRNDHPNHIENFQQIQADEDDCDDDDSISDQSSTAERRPPYSFNIDKSSIFHPSKSTVFYQSESEATNRRRLSVSIRNGEAHIKPDSFAELKRITDEKMSKIKNSFVKNKANQSTEPNEQNEQQDDSYELVLNPKTQESITIPKLGANTRRLIEFAKELERTDCNLHARMGRDERKELKGQNSAARKKTIVEYGDANTSTLIQIGAIAKEMRSDRLNH